MRLTRHPLVGRDLIALVDHIVEVTQGDHVAAARHLDEIDTLLANVADDPNSGMRLAAPLDGWLVRHRGHGHRLTIVIRADCTLPPFTLCWSRLAGKTSMRANRGKTSQGRWRNVF